MITEKTGIRNIRMLYVQLLYRCNFACLHCFHGELLRAPDQYTAEEAKELLAHFRDSYRLEAVTLLGGEPLLHPDIVEVTRHAAGLGLRVEICTNGHFGFRGQLEAITPWLAKLRVSLEGLRDTNDRIRQRGSFDSAMRSIAMARELNVPVGVTMTVTALNLPEVVPLARVLEAAGVAELKLHCLRPVGNAADHPELLVLDESRYTDLHRDIEQAGLGIDVLYDADLAPHRHGEACPNLVATDTLDRIEVDPRGGLTVSCKAVGRNANAFRWDKTTRSIRYEPHHGDEFALSIPDVIYRSA